jgi:hypothetical protein
MHETGLCFLSSHCLWVSAGIYNDSFTNLWEFSQGSSASMQHDTLKKDSGTDTQVPMGTLIFNCLECCYFLELPNCKLPEVPETYSGLFLPQCY